MKALTIKDIILEKIAAAGADGLCNTECRGCYKTNLGYLCDHKPDLYCCRLAKLEKVVICNTRLVLLEMLVLLETEEGTE